MRQINVMTSCDAEWLTFHSKLLVIRVPCRLNSLKHCQATGTGLPIKGAAAASAVVILPLVSLLPASRHKSEMSMWAAERSPCSQSHDNCTITNFEYHCLIIRKACYADYHHLQPRHANRDPTYIQMPIHAQHRALPLALCLLKTDSEASTVDVCCFMKHQLLMISASSTSTRRVCIAGT